MTRFDINELVDFCLGQDGHPTANFDKYYPMTKDQLRTDLNNKQYQGQEPVTYQELLAWSVGGGTNDNSVLPRIERLEAGTSHSVGTIRAFCRAALMMINTPGMSFDFSKADRVAMLDALVTASVLNATDKSDLQALSTVQISEVEQLFEIGLEVSNTHCNFIRAKLDEEYEKRNPGG